MKHARILISFCCLRTYRSIIDDRIGKEIFSVKTRAGAKAIGESVDEVHGADKPLDPNYKPEHQSKSKLPSVIGNKSPFKSVRKPPPQTPVRSPPRRVMTPKSVMSWPENQGILFFYISQTLQMNRISFMASLLNAVL